MALNTTLGQCVAKVQHEAGLSATPNLGQNFRATVIYQINAAQEYYFKDHKWPHLNGDENNGLFEKLSQDGENVYDFPANLDPRSIKKAWAKWGGIWQKLTYGICQEEDYLLSDSDDEDQTSDPPQKWLLRSMTQFEIWPRSASDNLPIRFSGQAKLVPLVSDSDVLVLDDTFIVQRAAGKLLSSRDKQKAALCLAEAEKMYRKERHDLERGSKANLAGEAPEGYDPQNATLIGVTAAHDE